MSKLVNLRLGLGGLLPWRIGLAISHPVTSQAPVTAGEELTGEIDVLNLALAILCSTVLTGRIAALLKNSEAFGSMQVRLLISDMERREDG